MQSDLGSSMQMLNELKQSYFNQSRVVVLSGGLESFRGMTNLGIRSVFMDMIAKNETLRRQYAYGIQQINQTLLAIDGRDADIQTVVEWGEALPVDNREELDLIQRQMQLGLISKRTAANMLGINYDTELGNMVEETTLQAELTDGLPMGISQ